MTLADVAARGRAKAAARFTETCKIWADPADRSNDTLDPETLRVVPGARTPVWEGPCAIRVEQRVAVDVGRTETTPVQPDQDADYRGLLPVDAPLLTTAHTLQVLTSTDDPTLPGREFRAARNAPTGSLRVFQRVPLRAVRTAGIP